MNTRLSKTIAICFVVTSITSCTLFKPYQAELGQGNFVRESQVTQLEIGQTPEQVLFLLGTPLLTGERRDHRWIYPIFDQSQGYSKLIVWFDNGQVSEITQE